MNLKWQVVDHVGLKRPFWKLPLLSCKNGKALRKGGVKADLTPPNECTAANKNKYSFPRYKQLC